MPPRTISTDDLRLLALMAELVSAERAKQKTWETLVNEIGLSKPQLMDLENGVGGLGRKTLTAFATAFFDGSVDRMYQAAREAAEKRPTTARVVELDPVNPKEAVRASALYAKAKPKARAFFDARDPYTAGDAAKDEEWYTRRLLHWIEAERNGDLDEIADATPVAPRKKKAKS